MSISTEKDPTCVVEMLNCLRPISQRKSTASGSRRGSKVSTRLQFEPSIGANNSSIREFSHSESYTTNFQTHVKRPRHSIQEETVPESPWEYQLLKANLLKAKSEIEVQENLINKLHFVHREHEQLFENEKAALRLRYEEAHNMVQNLESRIEILTSRSRDSKDELSETKSKLMAAKQSYTENLQRLEKRNAELREQLNESQLGAHKSTVSDQWRVTQLESELKGALDESGEHQKRVSELDAKLKEAKQNNQQAEVLEQQLQEAQFRIRSLESAQEDNKEAVAMAKQQQHKLLKYPELEREVERLREETGRLRGLVQNKLMLEEKVASLQTRLVLSEQRDRELAQLQSTHTSVQRKLDEWLSLARDLCLESGPAGVRKELDRLQQQELQLTTDAGELKSRLKAAQESKTLLTSELDTLKKDIVTLINTREIQKNYTHRINKKLQLIITERNSYRSQLDSYERDLTITSTASLMSSQHEQQRARIESLEKALEGYRELVTKLESDLEKDRNDGSFRGSGDQLEKVAALESERDALRHTIGEQRCRLEGFELEMKYRALKGDFNPSQTKVVHMRMNPRSEAESERADELALLRTECARLRERVRLMQENQAGVADLTLVTDERLKVSNSVEIQDLRSQVKSLELKMQRLKEAFKATSNEFREIVYMVLGYRIDRHDNHEYRLSSMYAESPDDVLTFKYNRSIGDVELMGTPYSNTLNSLIDLHLRRQHSIPVFLSAVTLDLFSQQTFSSVGTSTPDPSQQ